MRFAYIIFAFSFVFLIPNGVLSQCPEGDIELTTQAEVIAFKRQYPNCTEIRGSLSIGDFNTDIHDISPLSKIQTIDSFILIRNCILLEDIEVLNNLTSIGGEVYIYGLENLRELSFLRNFKSYINIELSDLPNLKNLDDIAHIEHIENQLSLRAINVPLPVDGAIRNIGGFISFYNNPGITDLEYFSNLDSIENIFIDGNINLEDIKGLNNIKKEVAHIYLQNNINLNSCAIEKICTALTQDTTNVLIKNNGPDCSDIDLLKESCGVTLPDCPTARIDIRGQSQLNLFAATYPNCSIIEESLTISSSPEDEIVDLSPIGYITNVRGSISISNNFELKNFVGLEQLDSVGSMHIANNDKLESLKGLDNISYMDRFSLFNNNSIRDISSINYGEINLDKVSIYDNITLTDISPLSTIDTLSSLYLKDNFAIANLNQLSGIEYIESFQLRGKHGFRSIDNTFSEELSVGLLFMHSTDSITDIDLGTSIIIKEDLEISYVSGLETIKLNKFDNTIDKITIRGNVTLKTIDFGEGPNQIEEYLYITNNTALNNINLPTETSYIKETNIRSNYELKEIKGGDNLKNMIELTIAGNSQLTNIDGLNHSTIIDTINISSNRELDDCAIEPLCLIPNLSYLTVSSNKGPCKSTVISISHCAQDIKNPFTHVVITSLEDLNVLKETYPNADSILGNLTFDGVTDISSADLDYFQQIIAIDSNLTFRNSDILSLDDFAHLKFQNLDVSNCPNIVTFPLFVHLDYAWRVSISNNPELKSILGLSNLIETDRLSIVNNESLSTLEGLENLRKTNRLDLKNIPIVNVKPLSDLEHLGGFYLQNCSNIVTLKDFNNLKSYNGGWIWSNFALKSLFNTLPFDTLRSALYINKNYNLEEISGFENIKYIDGYLNINEANEIIDLNAFPKLEAASFITLTSNLNMISLEFPKLKSMGRLEILRNPNLLSINDLSNLTALEYELKIESNPNLVDISSISDSLIVKYIEILSNPKLDDCSLPFICEHLKRGKKINFIKNNTNCITEAIVENRCDFIPKKCPSIGYTIDGDITSKVYNDFYQDCRVLNGNLRIIDNITVDPSVQKLNVIMGDNVISCSGLESLIFDNLEYIRGNLFLNGTRDLTTVSLSKFKKSDNNTFTNIQINENSDLISTPNINAFTATRLSMTINNNPSLISIGGLDHIDHISKLEISENNKLVEIINFKGLNSIDELAIHDNPQLENLSAFDHNFDAEYITAFNNPKLSYCSVKGFCHHIENDREHNFYNNLDGCNSSEEILAKCTVSVFDNGNTNDLNITVYPNPSNGIINIRTDLSINHLQLYDYQGRLIPFIKMDNSLDLSALNSGVYILFISTSEGISKHKVIINRF